MARNTIDLLRMLAEGGAAPRLDTPLPLVTSPGDPPFDSDAAVQLLPFIENPNAERVARENKVTPLGPAGPEPGGGSTGQPSQFEKAEIQRQTEKLAKENTDEEGNFDSEKFLAGMGALFQNISTNLLNQSRQPTALDKLLARRQQEKQAAQAAKERQFERDFRQSREDRRIQEREEDNTAAEIAAARERDRENSP